MSKTSRCRVCHTHVWGFKRASKTFKTRSLPQSCPEISKEQTWNFLSHKLQTRASHAKLAFQKWNAEFTTFARLRSQQDRVVFAKHGRMNLKKEVSERGQRDKVSSWPTMTELQRNRALSWQRLFPTWRKVLWKLNVICQGTAMEASKGMLFEFEFT